MTNFQKNIPPQQKLLKRAKGKKVLFKLSNFSYTILLQKIIGLFLSIGNSLRSTKGFVKGSKVGANLRQIN